MKTNTKSMHLTPVGANIFADLGYESEEATALLEKTNRVISTKLQVRRGLMTELVNWMQSEKLSEKDAARVLGVTSSRIAEATSMNVTHFTIDALVSMVLRTGRQIELSIGQPGDQERL